MQRKATKNTRGPNANEKAFQGWLKDRPCCACNHSAPSIVNHCEGATFKHNKVLIGHFFCIPLCQKCDDVITHGSRKQFRETFGPQSDLFLALAAEYDLMRPAIIPDDVIQSIADWGR